MRRTPLIVIGVLVVVVLFLVLCTFVQRPYERIVLDRFGRIVEPTTLVRGWKLCLPTDRVVRVDGRSHLYTSNLQQMNVKGGTVSVRTFAAWRIKDPVTFYQTLSGNDDNAQRYLDQKITGLVQQAFSAHTLDEIFNAEKEVITDSLELDIRTKANEELKDQGMEIAQVGFSRLAFPPSVADAVYRRMVEDRNKRAVAIRAAGDGEAADIRNKALRTRTGLINDATAKAAGLKGAGDKEAIAILGAVMNDNEAKELYQFYKAMDLVQATFTKNTYLILPANSPFTSSLLSPPTPESTTRPRAGLPATKPDGGMAAPGTK